MRYLSALKGGLAVATALASPLAAQQVPVGPPAHASAPGNSSIAPIAIIGVVVVLAVVAAGVLAFLLL